ncbi:MAG TPA: chemotaxis response regulator protein-glutamate methylesterase [Steroidobacteraceae bacterium]|jgi:two-component system chemotaxis response regulator CheB
MTHSSARTRVLIIDDSALVRRILTELLSSDSTVEVVGTATDAYMAREKIKELRPDVLTLDVEMPKMDGITFLRNLMRLRPMPVVMVSSLTGHGADITLEALSLGAVDYLPKPQIDLAATLGEYRAELIEKVKMAAQARVHRLAELPSGSLPSSPRHSADVVLAKAPPPRFRTTDRIIAIGASTGGTAAIREVLMGLPPDAPGVLVTQHIPKDFSAQFAKRMNACCKVTVCEAQDGQQVLSGHVYIAPGDRHLLLVRDGARYICRLDDGPAVNRHKPSVDVLFRSVAQQAGRNAIGAILTGMGKDGAEGLKEMRDAGSPTIAQDEASSVVWGMPGAAVEAGAACQVLPLTAIGSQLCVLAAAMDITRKADCA